MVRRTPFSLQELCCHLVVDRLQFVVPKEFALTADTYHMMECYVKGKKHCYRILQHIYALYYKTSDVRIFNLSSHFDNTTFIKEINLEGVTRLDLSGSILPFASYKDSISRLRSVQYLNLRTWIDSSPCSAYHLNDECLLEIANSCTKLIELDVSGAKFTAAGIRAAFDLNVDMSGNRPFSNLRKLGLDIKCEEMEKISIYKLVLNSCPELQDMGLFPLSALEQVFKDRKGLNLEPLRLRYIPELMPSEEVKMSLGELKSLCPTFTQLSFNLGLFKNCELNRDSLPSSLTHLELYDWGDDDDPEVFMDDFERATLSILTVCGKYLRDLKLFIITLDVRLVDILKLCPKLVTLEIELSNTSPKFTSGITEDTPVHCCLRKLKLHYNWNQKKSDDWLIIKLLPNLTDLSLYNCKWNDNVLLTILKENDGVLKNIRKLSICKTNMPPSFIMFLLKHIDRYPYLTRVEFEPSTCDLSLSKSKESLFRKQEYFILKYIEDHKLTGLISVTFKCFHKSSRISAALLSL